MAWEECLLHEGELLRTQRVEDFNELRELGVREKEQKQIEWMSVAYSVTRKCLQNVLILVKEVRETCYYAFPTLLS